MRRIRKERKGAVGVGPVSGERGIEEEREGKREREKGFHKHRDKFFERQPNYTRIQKDYKFKGDESGLRRVRNSIPREN